VRKKREMQIRIATRRFRHRDAQPEYCTSHGRYLSVQRGIPIRGDEGAQREIADCRQQQI